MYVLGECIYTYYIIYVGIEKKFKDSRKFCIMLQLLLLMHFLEITWDS